MKLLTAEQECKMLENGRVNAERAASGEGCIHNVAALLGVLPTLQAEGLTGVLSECDIRSCPCLIASRFVGRTASAWH